MQVAAGLAISVVCLWLAARGLELAEVGRALAGAHYLWLLPALALYFAGVWVRAVRWHLLLLPVAVLPAARLFPVVVIGYMANNVLPARLGEIARCYLLRQRDGVPQSAALATVLLERVMDGITMLVFMAGALLFLPFSPGLYRLMGGAAVLFGGTAVVLVAVATRPALGMRLVAAATRPLPAHIGERVRPLATSFFSGLAALGTGEGPSGHGGRGGALLRVGALSGTAWLLEAGMYFTLMYAFPLAPSLPLAVLTTAVANLGTLIPSSPGYVGVFDFLGRSVLTQFGVPQEVALAYILVVHAALVVPISLLGFGYAAREGGLGWLTRADPRRGAGLSLRGTP
ncbi:MAG: flippase-like domain-containing protein [Chloroflexota bacterium]|nr:flippase-like domain-containing protein [Chloroflexota bacterium]